MSNTGNIIYTRLIKVSNDADELPLDIDGIKTSVSGKPQHVKINAVGEEGYVPPAASELCPVTPVGYDIAINASYSKIDATQYTINANVALSWIATETVTVTFVLQPQTSTGSDMPINITASVLTGYAGTNHEEVVTESGGFGIFEGLTMTSSSVTPSSIGGVPVNIHFNF